MRSVLTGFVCACLLGLTLPDSSLARQSSADSAAKAASLLQQSLAAQIGGGALTDLTISGTGTFMHHTNNESGPMTLTVLSSGTTQVVFQLPSGTRTETWSANSNGSGVVTGVGTKGTVSQSEGGSVLMPSAAWFSPAVLASFLSSSGYTASYIDSETRNGVAVDHLAAWHSPTIPAMASSVIPHDRIELYLAGATHLPSSLVVSIRPYHEPGTKPLSLRARSATEEVSFSDYQVVQGRMIPSHVRVYLGRVSSQNQILDLVISSTVVNSGASIAVPASSGPSTNN